MGTMQEEWIVGQIVKLEELKNLKSMASTSDAARYYAVTITELEKVIAYFNNYIVLPGGNSKVSGIG